MKINSNFEERVVITPEDYKWVPSPMPGVKRMMLDRIGDEVARATSLVRYAPGSVFSPHEHVGGEEFMVLEGIFSDEHEDYPAGSYVRNPIGTAHTPEIGPQGATIFVKLFQFDPKDQTQKTIDTRLAQWSCDTAAGQQVMPLHEFGQEKISLVRWAPGTTCNMHQHKGGEEIFVLDGVFYDAEGAYPKGTWLRNPHLSEHQPYTRAEGATIYMKTGHLITRDA